MRNTLVSLLLLLAVHAAPATAAEPKDVANARELFSAIAAAPNGERGVDQLRQPFANALYRSCGRVLTASGVTGLEPDDWKDLASRIHEQVAAELQAVPLEGPARREALESLGRRVTSDQAANALVARWLGHEPPKPAANLVSEDSAGDDGGGEPSLALASQLEAEAAGELAVVPDGSRVLAEVGGAGEGNGLLDSGEWVQLGLTIENRGERPWFSTSAFPESADPCIWVAPAAEYELGELHRPGDRVVLGAWLFISNECETDSPRELRIRLLDSHRAPGTPLSLRVALRPMELRAPAAANYRFDADMPGSSDGSQLREIAPALRFEVAQDFAFSSRTNPLEARVEYRAPEDLAPLFASFTLEEPGLLPSSDGQLLTAGDDLDATVIAREQFSAALRAASASEHWVPDGRQGRLWLAADVEVAVARPGTAGLSNAKAAEPACPADWPTAETLVELVRAYLQLRAHPVSPSLPQAVTAASGVELVFDDEGFAAAYLHLKPAARKAAATPKPLLYRFRSYRAVPVMALLRAPEPEPEAPPSRPITIEPLRMRLQLGGSWLSHGVAVPSMPDGEWLVGAKTAHLANLDLRFTVGRRLHAIAGFDWGFSRISYEAMHEVVGELGAGYLFPLDRLEIAPHLLGLVRYRKLMGTQTSESSLNLAAGLTARYRFNDWLGGYALAEYRFGADGPAASDGTKMVDGSGLRLGAGLAVFF